MTTTTKQKGAPTRPDHISFSQIQSARCLHRWRETRLLKKYPQESPALVAGKFVHETVYRYVRELQASPLADEDKHDAEVMERLIEENFARFPVDETDYIQLRTALLEFAEKGYDPGRILAVERTFRVEPGKGMVFEGRIDRLNSYREGPDLVLEILDYKNTAKIPSRTEVAEDLQLRLYRYACMRHLHPGYSRVRWGIYCTRYNTTVWSGDPVAANETAKDDDALEKFIRMQWRRIMETPLEAMTPTPGPQCWHWACPILAAGNCPAFRDKAIEKAMASGTTEDRIRACRAKAMEVKEMMAAVQAEMLGKAMMVVDGKDAGYRVSASERYPLVPFHALAMERGLSLSHIAVSKKDVTKACGGKKKLEKTDGLPTALEEIVEVTKATRWTI